MADRTPEAGTEKGVECCPQTRLGQWGPAEGPKMHSVEQCRAYAAEHKILGADPRNSARRTTLLMNISRSWTALAHQLESLAVIVKSEGK